MTNLTDGFFLKINKNLFGIGLSPIELLVLAQVMELDKNTKDCFISDEKLADNFCVSKSTISRALTNLEGKGFIIRATKNVKGGKERHITLNLNAIERAITNIKMKVDDSNKHQNDF